MNAAELPDVTVIRCPLRHNSVRFVESVVSRELALAYSEQYNAHVEGLFGEHGSIGFYRCGECGLGFFHPATPGSPEFYSQLSKISWYYADDKAEYRLAARRIKPRQKVLEVGCGKGAFTKYLSSPEYVGLEYNTDAVQKGREAGFDVRAVSSEDFSLTHDGQFDVVCSFQVLEHVRDPLSFIQSCVKCARPGGLVIFGVPNSGAFIGASPDDILSMPPHHLTWWDETVFWRVAAQFGLEVVAMEAEPLLSVDAYATVKAMRVLMRKAGINRLFFFRGARHRLIRLIAKALNGFMMVGMYDPRLSAAGNSLLAVFRKI